MKRRSFLGLAGAAALTPLAWATARPIGKGRSSVVAAIPYWPGYEEAIVIDALAGPIQFNIPQEGFPLGGAALEQVRLSGITAVNLTVNGSATEEATAYQTTVAQIAEWNREVGAHPSVLSIVRNSADLQDAKATGRLGLVLGFQDAVPFEGDLDLLESFYESGVRIIQLTYNVENKMGTGCLASRDDGLTDLGREAVARLDSLGILIDLSHCGPRTTLDAIEASSRPVSVTHSGCSAVFQHPRSKDDVTLRRLADRGGVIGIYLMPFLNTSGPPTAADVLTHLEHALNVCGEDHVGIGSDQGIVPLDASGDFPTRFEAVSAQRAAAGIAAPREDTIPYVPELNHARRLESIADAMASRGHPSRVIVKVLGANFARLFGEVWS